MPKSSEKLCPLCSRPLSYKRGVWSMCIVCNALYGPDELSNAEDTIDLFLFLIGSSSAEELELDCPRPGEIVFPGYETWYLEASGKMRPRQERGLYGLTVAQKVDKPIFIVPDAPSVLRLRAAGLVGVSAPLGSERFPDLGREVFLWTPYSDMIQSAISGAEKMQLSYPTKLWVECRYNQDQWLQQIQDEVNVIRSGIRKQRTLRGSIVPGWPDNLRLPPGYQVGSDGIYKLTNRGFMHVSPAQFIVKRIYEGPKPTAEVACKIKTNWRNAFVYLNEITKPDALIEKLSGVINLAPATARHLAVYFQDFLLENDDIPRNEQIDNLGWHQNLKGTFVSYRLANKIYSADGVTEPDFVSASTELANACNLIQRRGEDEVTLEYLGQLYSKYPVVAFLTAGSLAAMVLGPTRCPSFIIDLYGPTSIGKTTALTLAASSIGNPVLGDGKNGLLFRASRLPSDSSILAFRDLPVYLDDHIDLQTARWVRLADGYGGCRSVLLTTGNTPLAEKSQALVARTLYLSAEPFPENTNVDWYRSFVQENYGTLAPLFLTYCLQHPTIITTAFARYRSLFTAKQPLIHRRGQYCAAVATANHVLYKLGFKGRIGKLLQLVYRDLSFKDEPLSFDEQVAERRNPFDEAVHS